jgi:hypothetical protein
MKGAPDVRVASGLEHAPDDVDTDLLDQDLGFRGSFRCQFSLAELRLRARAAGTLCGAAAPA